MKKLFFLLVASNLYFAQNITFGDENFKKTLIKTYPNLDADKDSEISFEEAKTLTSIRNLSLFNFIKIKSVAGIEAFINITELDLKQNQITAIDLSQNTKIKTLNLRENLIEGQLDISALTEATSVELNTNKITSIKLPTNGKIQFLYANDNLLTSIDLSGQPDLKRPYFVRNKITSMDFTNNTNVDRIHMDGNELSSLNLSGLTKLSWASFVGNKLTQITFNDNPALRSLLLQNNLLTELNFADNLANTLTLINLTGNNTFSKIFKDCNDAVSGVTPSTITVDTGCSLAASNVKNTEISIAPNPFKDVIKFSKPTKDIEVYDISGKKVFSQSGQNDSLNLNILPTGNYILKYNVNGKNETQLIMKK